MALVPWTEISVQNLFGDNQFYKWLSTVFAQKNHTHTTSNITDIGTNYAPISHSHNTWTTVDLNNSYVSKFSVNTDLKMCFLKYYHTSYNFNNTSERNIETGLIPSDYRPSTSVIGDAYNPTIGIGIDTSGNLFAYSTSTGSKTINASFMWHY